MTILRTFLYLFCTCLFLCHAQAEPLILYGQQDKPPKIYKAADGSAKGILPAIVKYIEKELGQPITLTLLPWARALQAAKQGSGGIVGFSKTAERELVFDFSQTPLYYDDVVVVVKKGHEFNFQTPEDLKNKRLAVPRGASYGPNFEAVKPLVNLVETNQVDLELEMLLVDRADAALISVGKLGVHCTIQGDPYLRAREKEFSILPHPFAVGPNYIAFAKIMKQTALLNKIDSILEHAQKSGALQKIIDNAQ